MRQITKDLASLFKEFGLYPNSNAESLKDVKPRNAIITYVFREFQHSCKVENGLKRAGLIQA